MRWLTPLALVPLALLGSCADDACERAPVRTVASCPQTIGEGFCQEGATHVPTDTAITWGHEPPHSGDHFPIWADKGEYDEPVERGYWVHNLEHGWIVLVYHCPDGCDAELAVLREVVAERPEVSIILTPDPLLEGSRFAAISWTWVHAFDTPVLDELLCFVDQHWDNAPESVP